MASKNTIISKIGNKMAPKGTILDRLEGKQTELNSYASTSRMQASRLTDEITDLHLSAKDSEVKADAISKALVILHNAGVEV